MERAQGKKDLGELSRQVEHHAGRFHLPTISRSGEKGKPVP